MKSAWATTQIFVKLVDSQISRDSGLAYMQKLLAYTANPIYGMSKPNHLIHDGGVKETNIKEKVPRPL